MFSIYLVEYLIVLWFGINDLLCKDINFLSMDFWILQMIQDEIVYAMILTYLNFDEVMM